MSGLDRAVELAEAYIDAAGGVRAGMCWLASSAIREALGWPLMEGSRAGVSHTWNVMPDGLWFDATAGQFGDDGPQVVDPDDPRYVVSRPGEQA